MKLKQYLNELAMKKDTTIKYLSNKPNEMVSEITIKGNKFTVGFYRSRIDSELDYSPYYRKLLADKVPHYRWYMGFTDESGTTATRSKEKGVAISLFAALEVMFKKFINEKNPEVIYFSGTAEKRNLYGLLAKKIAKYLKGKYDINDDTFYIYVD